MTIPGPPGVASEVEEAIGRYGLRPRRIELVSPLRERKGVRFAYRVESDDGRILKLRHFGSPADARRHLDLRTGLEPAFASVRTTHDAILFEEWVEGAPLTALEEEARAEEAGALLGRLHTRPLGPAAPSAVETRRWVEGAESDLAMLERARTLAPAEAARLRNEVHARDPRSAATTLIHLDFCAENMLIDRRGELRIIDNELLSINPPGLDLGRTFHRWPLPERAWTRFLRGYRSSGADVPEAVGFWKIAAALTGTRVYVQRIPERVDRSVALLRRFAAGEGLEDLT